MRRARGRGAGDPRRRRRSARGEALRALRRRARESRPRPASTQTPLGGFLHALWKTSDPGPADTVSTGPCPGCGASFSDFRESGRLGCTECYVTFEGQLRILIRRYHGSTHHHGRRHVGPVPADAPVPDDLARGLREQLRLAVARGELRAGRRAAGPAQGVGAVIDLTLVSDGGIGWLDASGPESHLVLSTRVRLARNLAGRPFPVRSAESDREDILASVRDAAVTSTDHRTGHPGPARPAGPPGPPAAP